MKIKFKKLTADAVVPRRAHKSDAGFDLTATSQWCDDLGNICYGTGIAVEIPDGCVGLIYPRSSIFKQDVILTNSVGVIDAGYRGEITFKFKPLVGVADESDTDTEYTELNTYSVGDRIGQLIIMPIPDVEFIEADTLSDSDRGQGGYGSTGK